MDGGVGCGRVGAAVLNIARLAPGGEDYYLATVATDVADYYAGRGEAPGRWVGEGARELGLTGMVTCERLKTVLGGVDSGTGQPLLSHRGRRVPGFDLAFRPPKSVSLLWALSKGDVSLEVRRRTRRR